MLLPITALYAGINALLIIALAFRVIGFRLKRRISVGDGGDSAVMLAMRGHANAVETVPIALILLGLIESAATPSWVVHALGVTFTIGRLSHAYHFSVRGASLYFRMYGMILSLIAIVLSALGLVGHALVDLTGAP